jgi:hypothetical protein
MLDQEPVDPVLGHEAAGIRAPFQSKLIPTVGP